MLSNIKLYIYLKFTLQREYLLLNYYKFMLKPLITSHCIREQRTPRATGQYNYTALVWNAEIIQYRKKDSRSFINNTTKHFGGKR